MEPPHRPKLLAYKFMNSNRAAALATTDLFGNPHVAIVYCVVRKDLSVYFSTRVEGRKYINLENNPAVAMAFSNEPSLQMLQLTGYAERIDDLGKEQEILQDLMRIRYRDPEWPLPPLKLFEHGATNELAVIKVSPQEVTFANFATPHTGQYQPFFEKIL